MPTYCGTFQWPRRMHSRIGPRAATGSSTWSRSVTCWPRGSSRWTSSTNRHRARLLEPNAQLRWKRGKASNLGQKLLPASILKERAFDDSPELKKAQQHGGHHPPHRRGRRDVLLARSTHEPETSADRTIDFALPGRRIMRSQCNSTIKCVVGGGDHWCAVFECVKRWMGKWVDGWMDGWIDG